MYKDMGRTILCHFDKTTYFEKLNFIEDAKKTINRVKKHTMTHLSNYELNTIFR